MPEAELLIEDKLISQLTTGMSQWTLREDIKNEEDIWDNIRKILNQNNINKLQGICITDEEMKQIKEFVLDQTTSPFKAAKWLAGEFGLAQIPLSREDATLGSISLDAINNREIAGGNSVYEVVHQCVTFKTDPSDRNRRFDVTLLINGFPMIHIELKNENNGYMKAFNQIKKYIGEGKFSGIFGMVQMFVVSNAIDTKYIANAPYDQFSPQFLCSWVNDNNKRIDNYIDFARDALNIPQAHLMVGKYSIIDESSKKLILLRPYQIHAIEAVKKASNHRKSGFVWHTTGSGKTITSFNVTKNLLDIPSIDKAVFLIDRKDLDQQTTLNFKSYAQSTGDTVEETDNTKALENCLKNDDRCVIVATRQKLDCLLDKCEKALKKGDETAYYYKVAKKIKNKNIAFVVDECHRAISSQAKDEISNFFNNSDKVALWYGFTGTPIFKENKKAELGRAARTTEDQYGECIHKYTIKEALKDRAVLGFNVQNSGFSREELDDYAVQLKIKSPRKGIENMERITLERKVIEAYRKLYGEDFYDSPAHRENVIDYICNKSISLLQLRMPKGEAFQGILTCPNIRTAQLYYQEFKKFIEDNKVSERTRRVCPDFPKIAITYSVGENEDGAEANQKMMKQALNDYNAMFKTNWSLETIQAYNADLNNRLSRKYARFKNREEQLDIVIVVDRLLTGFDSLPLSTLYIDRPPMSPQGLIQAFSRTNRIYTDNKQWGNIITFQTPAIFKHAIENALQLYSNGGESSVVAPTYEKSKQEFIESYSCLTKITDSPATIDITGSSDEFLMSFVKAFQRFDQAFRAINTYEDWERENKADSELDSKGDSLYVFKLTKLELTVEMRDIYIGKYNNAIEELKKRNTSNTKEDPIDIQYKLELFSNDFVNYEYLVSLIQKYINSCDETDAYKQIDDPSINKYINNLMQKNPKLGQIVLEIWKELRENPKFFKGKQVITVINERVQEIIDDKITAFCNEWCVEKTDMLYFSKFYNGQGDLEISNMTKFCYIDRYKETHPNAIKLVYYRDVRKFAKELIVNEIQPLLKY